VYPNIVSSDFKLQFFLEKTAPVKAYVYSVEGKRVLSAEIEGRYGVNRIPLNAASLSAGKYVVQVRAGNKFFTASFVKK
jgi:hypothetical protein